MRLRCKLSDIGPCDPTKKNLRWKKMHKLVFDNNREMIQCAFSYLLQFRRQQNRSVAEFLHCCYRISELFQSNAEEPRGDHFQTQCPALWLQNLPTPQKSLRQALQATRIQPSLENCHLNMEIQTFISSTINFQIWGFKGSNLVVELPVTDPKLTQVLARGRISRCSLEVEWFVCCLKSQQEWWHWIEWLGWEIHRIVDLHRSMNPSPLYHPNSP